MSDPDRQYYEQLRAEAEQGVAAAEAKVQRQREHLAAAEAAVKEAQDYLAAVQAGDHPEYVEPGEHVTAQAGP